MTRENIDRSLEDEAASFSESFVTVYQSTVSCHRALENSSILEAEAEVLHSMISKHNTRTFL